MRKLFFSLLIILLALPTVWPFLQKGFFWTHDIIYLTRIYAAFQALADGQFPLRWISEFRYGEPLFNYYAPLPYYLGAIIHSLGFDFITTAKIIFITIAILSGLFMYLLAKECWGNWGGLISAVAYLYAPYRAVNLYIRGAFSEIFAFAWFPLIFWAYLKFSQTGKKNYLLLGSLSFAFLILTHNIMALIFTPFLLVWLIFLIFKGENKISLLSMAIPLVLSLGLSATYWLPALGEKNLVQSQKILLPLENFVNQFVKWDQFIQLKWDGFNISPELGPVQLILTPLAFLTALIIWRKQKKQAVLIFFIFSLFLISVWLQTKESLQVWLFLPLIQFIQFPWRLGGITIFFLALLGGSFVLLLKKHQRLTLISTAVVILLFGILQNHYFQPNNLQPETSDKDFLVLEEAYLPKDYLPTGVKENPPQKLIGPAEVLNYQPLKVDHLLRRSNFYSFSVQLGKTEEIVLPIYYFPGWRAFDNRAEIKTNKQSKTGLILLSLTPGQHEIYLKFTDTPLRQLGNLLSLTSLFAVVVIFLIDRRRQN